MRIFAYIGLLLIGLAMFSGCQAAKGNSSNSPSSPPTPPPQKATLTISLSGSGSGAVTSSPKGINCPSTCKATFKQGTKVTLTAAPGQRGCHGQLERRLRGQRAYLRYYFKGQPDCYREFPQG